MFDTSETRIGAMVDISPQNFRFATRSRKFGLKGYLSTKDRILSMATHKDAILYFKDGVLQLPMFSNILVAQETLKRLFPNFPSRQYVARMLKANGRYTYLEKEEIEGITYTTRHVLTKDYAAKTPEEFIEDRRVPDLG